MKCNSFCYTKLNQQETDPKVTLVYCAISRIYYPRDIYEQLRSKYTHAQIVIFTTSGHFFDDEIRDEHPMVTTLEFECSYIEAKTFQVADYKNGYDLGVALSNAYTTPPKSMCIISDGSLVNGTALMSGIAESLDTNIPVFGGMAGDGTRFESTLVSLNAPPIAGNVIAIGFYGDNLHIGGACNQGWSPVGIEFTITKSEKNILYELDNTNAYNILFDLLKPTSNEDFTTNTLYFPFLLQPMEEDEEEGVIRTPIAVNHEEKHLTYAGDMPVGSKVKLMKAGTIQLLDSTLTAAKDALGEHRQVDFVFATSCVGRRVVLDDMANEEYTEMQSVFGDSATYTGFYSYGEFFRSGKEKHCVLHNQTFTLTALSEHCP